MCKHTVPDGREVHCAYEGEPVGYVVWLASHPDERVAARDVHDALLELLALPGGRWPDWLAEAAADLAARETPDGRRYPCPCCGGFRLSEPPTGTFEICDVCGWEDDPVQFHDLDHRGGANAESLREARGRR